MAAETSKNTGAKASRRSFLAKLSLGVVGLAGVSTGLLGFGGRKSQSADIEFPGPDSIFHPAQDPRTDPRRG